MSINEIMVFCSSLIKMFSTLFLLRYYVVCGKGLNIGTSAAEASESVCKWKRPKYWDFFCRGVRRCLFGKGITIGTSAVEASESVCMWERVKHRVMYAPDDVELIFFLP